MHPWRPLPALLALVVAGPALTQEPQMSWQEAVAELAGERTRAETCVSLVKRYAADDNDVMARARLDYDSAKADMDAAIGALSVALAQGEAPDSFEALEPLISRGVEQRKAFCESALDLMPEQQDGTKNFLVDLLGKAVAAIVTAAKDIYIYHQEEDVLERQTIQTQVEATRWRPFEDIAP